MSDPQDPNLPRRRIDILNEWCWSVRIEQISGEYSAHVKVDMGPGALSSPSKYLDGETSFDDIVEKALDFAREIREEAGLE